MMAYWERITELHKDNVQLTEILRCDVACRTRWSETKSQTERESRWGEVDQTAHLRAFAARTHASAGAWTGPTELSAPGEPLPKKEKRPKRVGTKPSASATTKRTKKSAGDTVGHIGKDGKQKVCNFFGKPAGCKNGDKCSYAHEKKTE